METDYMESNYMEADYMEAEEMLFEQTDPCRHLVAGRTNTQEDHQLLLEPI